MNKNKVLSIVALLFIALSGCQNNSTSSSTSSISSSIVAKKEIKSITISNKNELTKDWYVGAEDRLVKISLKSTGVALDTALSDGTITITSSDPSVVQVNGKMIKALKNGKSTITVAAGSIKDSVEVEVSNLEYDEPVIKLDVYEDEVFETLAGHSLALPYISCVDNYGNDLTQYIKITSDLDIYAEINNSFFLSTVEGEHTLTYSVVHPLDETKTGSTTLKVKVYRNVLKKHDSTFSIENSFGVNEDQVVKSTNTGFATAHLNMNASTSYYVETTIIMPKNHHGGHCVGLTHYNPDDESKFMLATVDMGDYNYKWTEFDTTLSSWRIEDQDIWSWRLGEYRGLDIERSDTEFKLAVARNGRYFYTFVNDEYVGMYTENKYSDVDTHVGLFAHMPSEGIEYSKINYFSGEAAVSKKINELTNKGANYISSYVPDGGWAGASLNTNNRNFTINPVSSERGINFDFTNTSTGINDGMVSLYQYFDGTFSFEFDYKMTAVNSNPGDQFMYLEVRPRNYGSEILNFATKFNGGQEQNLIEQHTKFRNTYSDSTMSETWNSETITDYSKGCHYKLTRILRANDTLFRMEVNSIAKPEQKITLEKTYSSNYWNDQLLLLWHNMNVAGEYSNISWYSTK